MRHWWVSGVVTDHVLEYRAGKQALSIVREHGLRPSDIAAFVLPAIGPKWLVLVGLDRALLAQGWLQAADRRVLLFGASIGAWRALALAAQQPQRTHAALVEAYCGQRFTHADTPQMISDAYRRLIDQVYDERDIAHALRHPHFDLAIATVRARGAFGARHRLAQGLALGAAAVCNVASQRSQAMFFERVIFDSADTEAEAHPALRDVRGARVRLRERNARAVALASGTVPLYMASVRDPLDAPSGAYLDGGFSDYHINQPLDPGAGLALMGLHQARVVPSWLDKFAPWRNAPARTLSRLLVVSPSRAFVRSLPGSRVPTRDDFTRFVADPQARIERWHDVVSRSDELGARFVDDVTTGALASRVLPL